MKIVVLDDYTENPGDLSWDELGALGELTVYERTPVNDEDEIIRRIGDAELIYTNKTPISKKVIDACPGVKFIPLLATGYNVVDYVYAREKGIPVPNIPTYGTASVSQFSIAKMKDGATLINNARGQLINDPDVADALNSGKLAAAGLDMVYTEPIREDNPLLQAKNCIIPPHISWAPKENHQRIMDCAVANTEAYIEGAPINVVNP